MGEFLARDAGREVRDAGNADDFDVVVARHDDFRHGAHPHRIGADPGERLDLGGRLVTRPGGGEVNAAPDGDLLFFGRRIEFFAQARGIRLAHINELDAAVTVDAANERVDAQMIDVIFDHHKIARLVLRIDATRGIRDDEHFYAERIDHMDRVGDFSGTASFVAVKASAQHQQLFPRQFPENHLAGMSRDGGLREVGNIVIRDYDWLRDTLRDPSQPRADYQGHVRLEAG